MSFKNAYNTFKKHLTRNQIIFLSLLSSIIYWRWINFSTFFYSDWRFYFKEYLVSNFYPSFWTHGSIFLGEINILLWRYPLNFFSGLFGFLGFNSSVSEKFLFFWPIIILAPVAGYLLVRKITKSNLGGLIGSFIFSYNTYFLSIDTQGHELLTVAFIWAVFAILSFVNLLETKKKFFIPLTALLLFIVGFYDIRALYVTTAILAFYGLYNQLVIEKKWKTNLGVNLVGFLSIFLFLALLSMYWILPFASAQALSSNNILSRSILQNFYSVQNVTALFYPFWTGAEPTWFLIQKIPLHFWLFPILAFSGLITGRKNKQLLFFGLLALVGIFFAKQDSPPFAYVYNFFYAHIPGFSLFREASKFYFLTVLSYSVLIGAFSVYIFHFFKNKKYSKYIIVFLIAILPLWNTFPLLNGSIGRLFIPEAIPKDLEILNSFVNSKNDFSAIFWINMDYYWTASSNNHQVIDGSIATLKNWRDYLGIKFYDVDLDSVKQDGIKLQSFFKSVQGKRLLSQASYGYIALSLYNNEWTNPNISTKVWKDLGHTLSNLPYIKPLQVGTDNILLFKNLEQKPYIYLTEEKESIEKDVPFKSVNFTSKVPSEYKIRFDSEDSNFYLNFADKYHPDWKLYVGDFNWLNIILNKQSVLNDKYHFQNAAGLNSFYIEQKQICNGGKCNFTIFFKPQAYLYLGLIISFITLLIAIISTIYLYKKRI
ncbi:MAG: hypothetical protein A2798_01980 [Candidatus Levybacteria bacterium RIFCSPHIGHO2_01_FULL_37_17]|nr:MAG: hypothetical protein A2798_01980 [Candidatus Levybacteria bacterium RIFCSPHIGHO2_01_FULL_37_17]